LHTGKRGRPEKIINMEFLREATADHRVFEKQELARLIGVHQNTLSRYMKRNGVSQQYSNLTNADLDILTKVFKTKKPDLWHLDGHHKLIRWGIVIHEFIGGYSRKV
ncbi:hypothetical protein C8J56DRAFT_753515, partial [Mycena floridula]